VPLDAEPRELISALPDTGDLPLDDSSGDTGYRELMRRTGLVDGEAGTPVSAFNSSI
jgi:hypothetical protein